MVPLWVQCGVALLLGFAGVGGEFGSRLATRNEINFFGAGKMRTPLHKVEMTQRGYIQFLRWELRVPEIHEFTFCLWVQSKNLTYAHSFFSYSRNERERLVRSWISPRGRAIHLEIGGARLFTLRTYIAENQWYHVCQSWDNAEGRYAMWIDGRIVIQGLAPQMIGYAIPSGGDIVVGQEYTDFDKGLEEGIEGAVLGFNLLLASAFERLPPAEVASSPALAAPDTRRPARQVGRTPLGLRLVEESFGDCALGRGSPYVGGSTMLISWTRTPVRVFGGAILKNVENDCGVFTPRRT